MSYCSSRFRTVRRRTVEVRVGAVGVGGDNPIRIQSMTTSDTQDIDATVRESIALAEAGCEIVRITAPNVTAARCLREIRKRFSAAGFAGIPLVADIHFQPAAALEAVEHVEKVRVNPGNYADRKKFVVREYSDADYRHELERLHEAFSPLVRRAASLGRALRIGTNHGSLSDRIMNRYGDTPLGMVESALEFLRIARSHDFHDLILSMKASNPKVMIEAYRLLVERMDAEDMHYPLHLGVTEAGEGEDGRIKSAIGIGSLLLDGLGDTIRVSLTEDSVHEIPVARELADKAMSLWHDPEAAGEQDAVDPYHFNRRDISRLVLSESCAVGPEEPPRVIVRAASAAVVADLVRQLSTPRLRDRPAEGLLVPVRGPGDLAELCAAIPRAGLPVAFLVLELDPSLTPDMLRPLLHLCPGRLVLARSFSATEGEALESFATLVREAGQVLAPAVDPAQVAALAPVLARLREVPLIVHLPDPPRGSASAHAVGAHRRLIHELDRAGCRAALWIRNTDRSAIRSGPSFLSRLLEASLLSGTLLCDGIGDLISVETEPEAVRSVQLAYAVLQGAGSRISRTEFVACPSCGRTLFDLQSTTQRIRAKTEHLKGVKIAIMGCVVNGPGEMADADFGYVGGSPGRINLYVGKTCVQSNLPAAEADARLIALIREHGKWVDPEPAAEVVPAASADAPPRP